MSQACEGKQEAHGTDILTDISETTVPTFSIGSKKGFVLNGQINGVTVSILVDTGAAATVLSKEVWDRVNTTGAELDPVGAGVGLVGVQGSPLHLHGSTQQQLQLQGESFPVKMIVADALMSDVILGRDFLKVHGCIVELSETRDVLHFKERGMMVTLSDSTDKPEISCINVVLENTLQVPPHSEIETMGRVPPNASNEIWMVESSKQERNACMVARAVVKPDGVTVPVRLLNLRDETITIPKGTKIAEMERIPDDAVASTQESISETSSDHRSTLWEMVNKVDDRLNQNEKEQLYALLLDYSDIFAQSSDDFGRTGRMQHRIDTGDSPPIRQQTRRMPTFRRDEARKLVKEMLDKDVIQPSGSPWASPVVLVKKKDGSTRFCVDYRRVNAVTRKDAYPLPRVDETLDTLAGSKWFSTLDLISGYWQVEVSPEDREKTAFTTPSGLFEFKVMPFGLCNAPATFQRLMDMVLAGMQWKSCLVYLDDVIIVGKTFQDHLQNLREVFQRLREAGLKLKPTKCDFCALQVEFLGHIVSAEGVQTDPSKTEKVAQWPTPTSRREVQQFLGLANYYRRFVKDFAAIAKPLHRLTEKTVKFKWTNECQTAFEEIRRRLVTAPILAFPDYERAFILDTDASDIGIGAVLSQVQEDGSERVIAYASRVLTRPERRYCVTRRELLAVVTFVQHFRPYLLGRRFLLRTDHGSLTWLSNFKEPEGQLARWLERLQEYDFTIAHRPGRKHQNADALSRRPCSQCGRESHFDNTVIAAEQQTSILTERSPAELRKIQLDDDPIGFVLKAVEKGERPNSDDVRGHGPDAQHLNQLWNRLLIDNGVLKRKYIDTNGTSCIQLIAPRAIREEILQEIHAGELGGHLGEDKTHSKIKQRFYWPGMRKDVERWCHTCEACATRKTAPKKNCSPLQTVQAGYPMQVVGVDIMGPLPESEAGNSYVLVASDYFTKWVEVYAIPNQEAVTVAKKLTDEMFCRFSPPEQLHSDQGRQFESELMKEICKLLNIRKTRTTPYHPQCDGLVERFNRTLLNMLATTTRQYPFNWEDQIRKVCMAYNTSVHSSTGYTPFYLMFGREARLPIDLMYGTGNNKDMPITEYANQLKKGLEDAYSCAREKLGASHERQKEHYDKRIHGQPFTDGDLVWLHSTVIPPGQSKKLHHPWTGPYKIIEKISDSDYKIKGLRGRKQTHIVHFDRLKLCTPGTRFESELDDSEHQPSTDANEQSTTPQVFGQDMELLENEPTRRYPLRYRHPPERFAQFVTHS